MEFELDFTKSAQENANAYFEASKLAKKKRSKAIEIVKDLEKKLEQSRAVEEVVKITAITKKEWYEKFYWFFTSSKMLAIGGRDAAQNELINSKYFEEKDLFFHADIFGASVLILKNGLEADEASKEEAAQFAASFSRAWSSGLASVNVYSMKREQVSKSTNKGYLASGSFALSGERAWFKDMSLIIYAFIENDKFMVVPSRTFERLNIKKAVELKPGNIKKSEAAKKIANMLGYNGIDYIMQHIPPGNFQIKPIGK
ncbi:MAG: NFACT RNA binding domain-containing protein [Candidatus Micrarchaeia archaeon]